MLLALGVRYIKQSVSVDVLRSLFRGFVEGYLPSRVQRANA